MTDLNRYLGALNYWSDAIDEGCSPNDNQQPIKEAFANWIHAGGVTAMIEQGVSEYLKDFAPEDKRFIIQQLLEDLVYTALLDKQTISKLREILAKELEA